ncbi:serine/threonine-protein kinase [Aeoliella sp. ICT_H6.2]|uniref:Serine/threonine-protein kinase n=1 Tax=Aeoliella straminimaris TaxID=2954799 RepID=A0A9X2JIB4_9BACT|nr:serine/threonine-protein kinase [Aeoliella straminimaris]MCO6046392.1 serine/threonine-protein kinase [Aeoliella straminimaris]
MSDLKEFEKAIFRVALSLDDAEQREQFLNNVCRDNDLLRREIESLLAEDARAEGFMAMGVDPLGESIDVTEDWHEQSTSESIGRYKLLQKIGEGGFGDVYMAEQTEPIVRRVALKVIKLGMDTRQVIARFEAERQALAMMDHPNIAKVFDAGATSQGRPFFVMELVHGQPVTEFCDKNRLSTEQRLRLFANICNAVQHAHQKGIIHRDLKPSNVLVSQSDEGPIPKIIDFGIVKATQHRLTDKTLFTRFEQFIGTPYYMSPEQADPSRSDIDTRSDVYSLGVLLYELLTGKTPLDQNAIRGVGFDEIRRHICEDDTPAPSTRLAVLSQAEKTTVAANRDADPRFLDCILRQELDWVVLKALEKDRTRRYQSASELEDDVKGYLKGAPVAAVPPTTMYILQKFARRHRALLTMAAAISMILILATLVSTWQAVRATNALQISRRARAELALDKGQMLGDQGDANRALLWMARSLELVPERAPELERVIRVNLGSWQDRVNRVLQLLAPSGRVDAVAFAPDGNTVITAARQENNGVLIQQWNRENGHCKETIEHLDGRVLALDLCDDASMLAVGYADGRVELFNTKSREATPLSRQRGFITKVLFSPGGSRLLVASGRQVITELEGANEHTQALQGKGFVQLFDTATHHQELADPLAMGNLVWAADFAKDGTWFAVHAGPYAMPTKGNISFFKMSGEAYRPSLQIPVSAMSIAISGNGKYLLTGDSTQCARRWDLDTGEIIDEFSSDGPISVVAFSPVDEDIVLSGSFDGSVRLWNVRDGRQLGPSIRNKTLIRCAGFSEDGKVLYSGSMNAVQLVAPADASGTLTSPSYAPKYPLAFDFPRNAILVRDQFRLQLRTALTGQAIGESLPWKGPVIQAACDTESARAVIIGSTGVATLCNLESGQPIAKLLRQREPAFSTAISAQGLVAVGYFDGVVKLFDAQTGTPLDQEFAHRSHTGPVFSIDFHGDLMLTGGADGFARLWNVKTGQAINKFLHPTFCIAVFSPDGSRIATSGSDQTTRIWSSTGNLISAPLRHPSQATRPAFFADGELLVTGCLDGKARFWDVATSRQLGPAIVHTKDIDKGPFVCVAFWPDNHSMVTSTGLGYIVLPSQATPAIYHRIPTPLKGNVNDVALWAETITGMTLDENGIADVLSVNDWRQRREQLTQRGFLSRQSAE